IPNPVLLTANEKTVKARRDCKTIAIVFKSMHNLCFRFQDRMSAPALRTWGGRYFPYMKTRATYSLMSHSGMTRERLRVCESQKVHRGNSLPCVGHCPSV